MTIRKATVDDIGELTRLRILFLNGVNGREAPPEGFGEAMRQYLSRALADGSFVSFVAEEGGRIAATSGVCFYHVAPNYSNPTGGVAYVVNMFTLPDYRRQGLASKLLEKIIEEAKGRGYRKLALHAEPMARKLYEGFGFAGAEDEMVQYIKI